MELRAHFSKSSFLPACFLQKLSYLLPSCLPACFLYLPASFTCLPACFLLCLFSSSAFCFFCLPIYFRTSHNATWTVDIRQKCWTVYSCSRTFSCCWRMRVVLFFTKISEISQMSVFDINLKSLEKALALVLRKCRWPSGTNVTTLEIKHLIRLNQKKSAMKEM